MRTALAVLTVAALAVSGLQVARAAASPHGPMPMKIPPIRIQMAADSVVIPMQLVDGHTSGAFVCCQIGLARVIRKLDIRTYVLTHVV